MNLNFTYTLFFLQQLCTYDAFQPNLSRSILSSPLIKKSTTHLHAAIDPSNNNNEHNVPPPPSTTTAASTATTQNGSDGFILDNFENKALNVQNQMNQDVNPNTDVKAGKVIGPANVLVYDTSLRGTYAIGNILNNLQTYIFHGSYILT